MLVFLEKGTTRRCFLNKLTGYVHKQTIEDNHGCRRTERANKNEVDIWLFVEGTDLEKYFLPVVDYSPDYAEVIVPFSPDVQWERISPELKLPTNWDDCGIFNLGLYRDRVVIRDYGDLTICDLDHWMDAKTLLEAR